MYEPATAHDQSDLENLRVSTVETTGLCTEIATWIHFALFCPH